MAYELGVAPDDGIYVKVMLDEGRLNGPALDPQSETDRVRARRGVPIDGSEMVKRARWLGRRGQTPPDFTSAHKFAVSARARDLIEQLEPGVHQFFPVDFVTRKGVFLETRFWLVICNLIDAIDPEHSNLVLSPAGNWVDPEFAQSRGYEIPASVDLDSPAEWVFKREAVGQRHFWHDSRLSGIFMSDEAAAAIKAAGLTGVRLSEKNWIGEV